MPFKTEGHFKLPVIGFDKLHEQHQLFPLDAPLL